ncbi:hypothetical protein [Spiroplasma tabanidicola]|uniref:Uncharacterized protein n=1 Tax=Spiroplasma tabanidicola TaxID=324079 RepID=A0A6I6CC14_9MOLU|nr:hypothetical protein [Spiroplasma tabanidicola]QGS51484.1 hypothetical protein STABA_v1c01170 [Spiroplasma tabanidicola]
MNQKKTIKVQKIYLIKVVGVKEGLTKITAKYDKGSKDINVTVNEAVEEEIKDLCSVDGSVVLYTDGDESEELAKPIAIAEINKQLKPTVAYVESDFSFEYVGKTSATNAKLRVKPAENSKKLKGDVMFDIKKETRTDLSTIFPDNKLEVTAVKIEYVRAEIQTQIRTKVNGATVVTDFDTKDYVEPASDKNKNGSITIFAAKNSDKLKSLVTLEVVWKSSSK